MTCSINWKLQELARGGRGIALPELGMESSDRGGRGGADGGDLVPEVSKRGAYVRGGNDDARESCAEADEARSPRRPARRLARRPARGRSPLQEEEIGDFIPTVRKY
jgi:hypothetical protein